MLLRSFVFAALPLLALAFASCDSHSWESTKRLHEHGDYGAHGDKAHGNDPHGEDAHAEEDAHQEPETEHQQDAGAEGGDEAPAAPLPNPVLPGES